VHVGTERAARIALEARIGTPADGYGWGGGKEYGKTLLAGQDTLRKMGQITDVFGASGYNSGAPKQDYYPTERTDRAKFSSGTPVDFNSRPAVRAYQITGKMGRVTTDARANAMAKSLKQSGVFYRNEAEDSGHLSAVVPNKAWLTMVK
jgi:hypothetical protein